MSWTVIDALSPQEEHACAPVTAIGRLKKWWTEAPLGTGEAPRESLDRVCFLYVDIRAAAYLQNRHTRIGPHVVECPRATPAETPLVVLYAIPSAVEREIYILGALPHEKLRSRLANGLEIRDLQHSGAYTMAPPQTTDAVATAVPGAKQTKKKKGAVPPKGASLVQKERATPVPPQPTAIVTEIRPPPTWEGTRDKSMWIKFPFEPPITAATAKQHASVSIDRVRYRASLVSCFWEHRNNTQFTQGDRNAARGDGDEMLRVLHEGELESSLQDNDVYMALNTVTGRSDELSAYWALAWTVSWEPTVWPQWLHFERQLLAFRLARYFCRDHHFSLLCVRNNLLAVNADQERQGRAVFLPSPPDPREVALYRWRWPDGQLPRNWIRVPLQQVSKDIAGHLAYDIDGGRVVITYRDLFDWAWTRQEAAALLFLRHSYQCTHSRVPLARVPGDDAIRISATGEKIRHGRIVRALKKSKLGHDRQWGGRSSLSDGRSSLSDGRSSLQGGSGGDDDGGRSQSPPPPEGEGPLLRDDDEEHLVWMDQILVGLTVNMERATRNAEAEFASKRLRGSHRRSSRRRRSSQPLADDGPSATEKESDPQKDRAGDARAEDQVNSIPRTTTAVANQVIALPPSGLADLIKLAKEAMPPCMARHIWRAVVKGVHPNNESRLALAMFLLDDGYTVEEVDRIIYMLYAADTTFVQKNHRATGWTPAAYKQEYQGNVQQLYVRVVEQKVVGPFGCAKLVSVASKDSPHGCPFVGSLVRRDAHDILAWAGTKETDIEDILSSNHPQGCCTKYFSERNPESADRMIVRHPNQFFRGGHSPQGALPALTTTTTTEALPTPDQPQDGKEPPEKRGKTA